MTDEMTTGPSPYVEPALTVRATYHASDGRVPEEITIEFGGDQTVDADLIDRAVAALANVAAGRVSHYGVSTLRRLDDDLAAAGARQTVTAATSTAASTEASA